MKEGEKKCAQAVTIIIIIIIIMTAVIACTRAPWPSIPSAVLLVLSPPFASLWGVRCLGSRR